MSLFKSTLFIIGFTLIGMIAVCCGDGPADTNSKDDGDQSTADAGLTDTHTDTDTDTETASDTGASEVSIALLVDDFEDGDDVALTGGAWYTYDDSGDEGRSTVDVSRDDDGRLVMDGEGYESDRSLSLSYFLDVGDWIWEPYIGWGVGLGEETAPFDATPYSGLTYAYKGSSHFVYIYTYEVTNFDYYRAYLPETEDWQVVTLRFTEFDQQGWDGIYVPFNLDNVGYIGWEYKGATGDEGSIAVDNVAFFTEEPVEIEPDLTIRERDPPADEVIDSVEIENPLQELVLSSLNKGYNLTNWLEQAKLEAYEFDETYMSYLSEAGFKGLRLPIDLDLYIEDRAGYFAGEAEFSSEPLLFDILDNFDQWTRAAGLSLTIDYHQYDASFDMEDPLYVDAVIRLWTEVAAHFADNPREDLFYEIMNEPELAGGVSAVSNTEWTAFAEQIIDGIRSADTAHVILFGDVEWNGIAPLIEREPFDDDRMAYVFHFYEPFVFTHQGAGWSNMSSTHDIPYPYSPDRWSEHSADFGFGPAQEEWQFSQLESYYRIGNKSWIRNQIVEAKRWAVKNDVPLVCNEFGVFDRTARKEDIVNYYTDFTDIMEELEIPWQIWFMVMDDAGNVDTDLKEALGLE
jgi:endoglucanase